MQNLSRRAADELGALLNSDEKKIEVYAYSLEILILLLMTMFFVIVLALLLGCLRTTLVFLVVFAPFRCFGGGAHLGSGKRCVLVSTITLVSFGYLSCTVISEQLLIGLLTAAILLGVYSIIKWVPAGTAKHQITDDRIRFIQKINMSVSLLIYAIVIFILITAGSLNDAFALTLGAIVSLILITPLGYNIVGAIDNIIEILITRR